jgi:mRNA-degrading endonuclease HigB of HigAB toxin-antitoxin module
MSIVSAPLHLIINNYVSLVSANEIEIVEANETGAGKAVFKLTGPAICIKHYKDRPPLRWLNNQKCADGAILHEVGSDLDLHIVELKKSVSEGKWVDIKDQFEGMIYNALSIMAVLGVGKPTRIICHIAYEFDKITTQSAANSVLLKYPTGIARPLGGVLEWSQSTIQLKNYGSIVLKKIIRNEESKGEGDLSSA